MIKDLQQRIQGKKVLILGIGNRLRGDDALGSLLAEGLVGKVNVPVIDASDVPENYLGPIESSGADLVIVLDGADLGATPGDLSLIEMEQLRELVFRPIRPTWRCYSRLSPLRTGRMRL